MKYPRISLISFALIPASAAASDFGPGLLFVLVGVIVAFTWPLVIPLFYLRGIQCKTKLYLASALASYGLVAAWGVPAQVLLLFDIDVAENLTIGALYLTQPLAFLTSLWVIPKIKRILAPPEAAP